MTVIDLAAQLQAVCPILNCNINGDFTPDPAATPQQIAAAKAIVAPLRPARIPVTYQTMYNTLKGLTQAQQMQVLGSVCSFVLVNNPQVAAQINAAFGLNLPFDQPNP